LNGCEAIWSFSNQFEIPQNKSRTIKVSAAYHPLSWNRDQNNGLEKDLIEKFAKDVGYEIKWMPVPSAKASLQKLKEGKSDIAIGRLNLDLANEAQALAGPSYEESPMVVICPKNKPQLQVLENPQKQGRELLRLIANRKSACALLEKNEARYYLRFFPSLQIIREETPPLSLGFLISQERPEIQKLLMSWFQRASRSREIMKIRDRYYGHLESLDEMDQARFFRLSQSTLPALLPTFQSVAKEFDLPWQLIAAVAYQESQWNNDAISFTGVRGIMMLTLETADHLGIEDRTDLAQSLWGGAKYLRLLINAQPHFLNERDRMIFALATYNVGPAHMRDAQKLAVRLAKNPYSWKDMKKILPFLSSEEFYITLEYGEARGEEPVDFANRVLGFYDLLNRH